MVIVPGFPPFFPLSRPQAIREHRDQWGKETEGKEVTSYRSRTCTRSIGAVMEEETQSSPSDIQLGLQTIDLTNESSAFSRSSLSPLDSSPFNILSYSPYPLAFDPKSLIVYICVCVLVRKQIARDAKETSVGGSKQKGSTRPFDIPPRQQVVHLPDQPGIF
jgi:hypothetical protein